MKNKQPPYLRFNTKVRRFYLSLNKNNLVIEWGNHYSAQLAAVTADNTELLTLTYKVGNLPAFAL